MSYKLPDDRTMRQQLLAGQTIVLRPDRTDWPVVFVSQRAVDEHLFEIDVAIQRAQVICAALGALS